MVTNAKLTPVIPKAITTHLDSEGILLATLDVADESMNVLRLDLIDQLKNAFEQAENNPAVKALILISGKPTSFVAGADISMIGTADTAQAATELAKKLQDATLLIERCSKPTIAAIHGACLGGGLELAMAFDYRIVSNAKSTKFGLPEVQLGLLPGGSGTQRLPRLVSLPTALDMMLSGKQLNAKRAYKAGLVDEVCSQSILLEMAKRLALKATGPLANQKKSTLKDRLLKSAPARALIFQQARKKLLAKTLGNYPAPETILEVVKVGLDDGFEAGLAAEREGFGQLVMTSESKELRQIFFSTTELKKDLGVDGDIKARKVEKIGVLGAGLMGAGVAYVSAKKAGVIVRIKDRDNQGLERGIQYINKILNGALKRRWITPLAKRQVQAKITSTKSYSGFASADIVIEAVFEDLNLKRQMVKDIESLEKDKEIIFASNTSAIPIDEIAKGSTQPERIIGMHYFSPVEKMPLLEIVKGRDTSDWVTATCVEFGKRQGKTVIVVNDGPGFYTTRILAPFIQEAIYLICEGVPIERIDNALQKFGFPVGPVTLLDEVGIDVGIHIADTLHKAFGERAAPASNIDKVIADERKGRKNKRGFYLYSDKKSKSDGKTVDKTVYSLLGVSEANNLLDEAIIVERCVLRMVNEAAYCLDEKILRSARDGDIGAIFGLGFPPFLGGPFRYIDALGADKVLQKIKTYEQQLGVRFSAAQGLIDRAEQDNPYY